MTPRLVLIALLSAFGIASAFAMITTIHHVETVTSSQLPRRI
jgi:hypothetical protein